MFNIVLHKYIIVCVLCKNYALQFCIASVELYMLEKKIQLIISVFVASDLG